MPTKYSKREWLLAAFFILAIGATVLIWALQVPFPLRDDEIMYLVSHCNQPWATPVQWGPGYKAFYCAISGLFPTFSLALYVKSAMVVLLTSVTLFSIALLLRVRPAVAAAISLSFTLTMLPFEHVNSTPEFAFLLAAMACLCPLVVSRPAGWYGFFLLTAMAFLVRPEYVLALVNGLLLLGWQASGKWRSRMPMRQTHVLPMLVGGVCLAFCVLYYVAGTQVPVDRTWVAFGQHFALNLKATTDMPGDTWLQWQTFVASAFPSSQSVAEAARENPAMFGWHLGYNLLHRLPTGLQSRIIPPFGYGQHWLNSSMLRFIILGIMLLVAAVGFWSWQWRDPAIRSRLAVLLVLLPIPLVSLLVMPHSKHMLPLLPLLVVLIGWGIEQCWASRFVVLKALPVALALVLVVGSASFLFATIPHLTNPQPSPDDLVADMQAHAAAGQPLHILSAAQLGSRMCQLAEIEQELCTGVTLPPNVIPSQFAQQERVNWILVDSMLRDNSAVQSDPVMQVLLNDAAQCGCQADPPMRGDFLLIRCYPTFSGCSTE